MKKITFNYDNKIVHAGRIKNNILCFYDGPFSQWWSQHPFTMTIPEISKIFTGSLCDYTIRDKFFEFFDSLENDYTMTFNCAEQAMMFGKALMFGDFKSTAKIMSTELPREQKQFGREVQNYDDAIWNSVRFKWVTRVNVAKFSQQECLKNFLLNDCKDVLIVEASPYDKIWGIGKGEKDEDSYCIDKWDGLNLLGKAIMNTREILQWNMSDLLM